MSKEMPIYDGRSRRVRPATPSSQSNKKKKPKKKKKINFKPLPFYHEVDIYQGMSDEEIKAHKDRVKSKSKK